MIDTDWKKREEKSSGIWNLQGGIASAAFSPRGIQSRQSISSKPREGTVSVGSQSACQLHCRLSEDSNENYAQWLICRSCTKQQKFAHIVTVMVM